MNAIFFKFGTIAIIAAVAFVSGIAFQVKVLDKPCPKPCPDVHCSCPQPTVTVQPFDVHKIKNLREFVYSPSFSGNIQVNGVDSAYVRKTIDESIQRALAPLSKHKKLK